MEVLRFLWRRTSLVFFLFKKHFFRGLASSSGLFLSILVVALLLGILRPVKKVLVQKMRGSLPSEMIRLTTKEKGTVAPDWRLFKAKRDASIGFSQNEVSKIKKWPEVSAVYVSQLLQQPALGKFDQSLLASFGWSFDVLLQGLDRAMVSDFLKCRKNFKVSYEGQSAGEKIPVIPVVVPETYVEIAYAYAMINGLPGVKPADIIGTRLRLTLGESVMGASAYTKKPILAEICGFAPQGLVSALGVPVDFVKSVHNQSGQMKAASSYDQIFVKIKPGMTQVVLEKARKAGYNTPVPSQKFNKIFKTLDQLDNVFWGIAIILLVLTAISLANSFTLIAMEKKYEFGLYLVFGASPFFIWLLMTLEGFFWGFIQAFLGLLAADKIFLWLQNNYAELPWLSSFTAGEFQNISFELSSQEKAMLVLGTAFFAAAFSLIPTIWILGRKTLNLVKKD